MLDGCTQEKNLSNVPPVPLVQKTKLSCLIISDKNTLEKSLLNYSAELSSVLNRPALLRKRRVTDRPSAPWLTSDILSLKADRRKAERRWRKSGSTDDKLVFKSLLFKFNQLVKQSKKLYYEARISAANSSKYLYGLVSHFCNKKKSSILPDNVPLKTLPNLFIEFFTSKINKIRTVF